MKLSGKPTLSPALLALGLFIFIPGRFAAQAAPQQPPVIIPPVEVVATRIPEAPHEVSASIEVISGADLRARGATSLKDALALATGIAIAPGGDAGRPDPGSRALVGISTARVSVTNTLRRRVVTPYGGRRRRCRAEKCGCPAISAPCANTRQAHTRELVPSCRAQSRSTPITTPPTR